MKNYFAIIFTALLILIGSAAAASAQSVSGSIGNGTVKRGGKAHATVTLSIPGGLHTNSNRPGSEFAIPTTVRVTAAGVKAGRVSYPPGRSKRFSFSDDALNVYEGRKSFTFDITVPPNFKGNTVRVKAVVSYQACTNEVCYAPASKTVNLTARVN